MYNRYIPGSNGIYERRTVSEPAQEQAALSPQAAPAESAAAAIPASPLPAMQPRFDTGDLLLLCIAALLLLDGEDADPSSILIMAAAFLFLS